ncbi:LLM class flavin-dependent oxidoreductase [Streptomyces mirabilis]|uniref:LLM class flavin-dependent oxidoreductase n=1 Tax=Streptomyces mirabilis TaxID=68239 RepID=UPI003323F00C
MTHGTSGLPRLGAVVLPEYDWRETRRVWTSLEDLGLHHAWTYDHLSWRTLRDAPWFDALTTLTAVASVTRTMELGTFVTSPNFRHPVVLAKQVMTLDQVSGGRFVFGMGAGAEGADARVLGSSPLSPHERAERFAEFVELSDLLLRQPSTTYRGSYFSAVDARMIPGCARQPRVPFALAAAGPRGLGLTARYGQWWVTIGDPANPGGGTESENWVILKRQVALLQDACERASRDVSGIRKVVSISRLVEAPYSSPERFVDLVGQCGELGFTDVVVNYPRREGVFSGDISLFESAMQHATVH